MIQNAFWRTALRWAWVIVACGLIGAVVAYLASRGDLLAASEDYSATTTLGVSRVISPGGVVTPSGDAENADAINRYTTALIQWASTPQFASRVEDRLREGGVDTSSIDVGNAISIAPEPDIPETAATVNVRPIPAQAITISASQDDEVLAQELVVAASQTIRTKAADDERQLRESILADADRTRQDLLARLNTTYEALNRELRAIGNPALAAALANLQERGPVNQPTAAQFATIVQDLARTSNNATLIFLQSQARALEQELQDLGSSAARLQAEAIGQSEPVVVTAQPETAATRAEPLVSRRGLIATGAVVGLLAGWLIANLAEQMRAARIDARDQRRTSEIVRGQA